jgi:hypothetical protein
MSLGWRVVRHANAESFLASAEGWLSQAEAHHNLILGLAHALRAEPSAHRSRPWLLSVHKGNVVIGCALATPRRDLILTQMEPLGVESLIRSLDAELPSLPGVVGPEPASGEFAAQWSKAMQRPSRVRMRQRFYVLRQAPTTLPGTPGRLRLAASSDLPLVAEWVARFNEDAVTRDPEDPREVAERAIGRRQLYLWQASRPVSMAGWTGAAPQGRRLSFVFTPAAERRRGYASACVAALSGQILSTGKSYCCLYADLANPTSNAIYRRIGYEPLYDATQYSLAGAPPDGRTRQAGRDPRDG